MHGFLSRRHSTTAFHSQPTLPCRKMLHATPLQTMEKTHETYRRSMGRWRLGLLFLALVCVGLLIAVIVLAVQLSNANASTANSTSTGNTESTQQPQQACSASEAVIDVSESEDPGPFHDLTASEMTQLEDYLYQQTDLSLAPVEASDLHRSVFFLAELFLPPKTAVLNYLQNNGPRPPRQARVIIIRGDKTPPVVEEYVVTLTGSNASRHQMLNSAVRKNPVPFDFRPFNNAEFGITYFLSLHMDNILGHILRDSFNATFQNCERCLTFYYIPLTSALEGRLSRKMWLKVMLNVEYYSVHPVDMAVLVDLSGNDFTKYAVQKVYYAGTIYPSMEDLVSKYNLTQTPKTKVQFPVQDENLFSAMHRRGSPVPPKPLQAPHLVEPDGKRYNIRHRHLEYMQWEADFRLSALQGPQLYDVRFNGERIAYEVGLQELALFYSGPGVNRLVDAVDSGALLGTNAKALIPGADCPVTATFISARFMKENERPMLLKRAICIFEQNTGIPLRRHMSYESHQGSFYAGLMDTVLVVRSILTIANYDYIIDFVLHQSGALQVRVHSTGYIFSTYFDGTDSPYGWRIHDHLLGNLHHHLFHFKVDMDILGTSNRYETLDISAEKVSNGDYTDNTQKDYWQTRFDRRLKNTEMDAVYDYNFDTPKYHLVYNEGNKTRQGVPRAFRIKMDGISKFLLPPDVNNEPSTPWARHQLVVTRHKDEESVSSTPYAYWDAFSPTVNFTSYYADNDPIVDQDLVFWVSMGVHHIPHTEDLPVTPTPGFSLDFTLLPYNYFPECPSMQSRDAIRLELQDPANPSQGVRVVRGGQAAQPQCPTQTRSLEQDLEEDPSLGLQTQA